MGKRRRREEEEEKKVAHEQQPPSSRKAEEEESCATRTSIPALPWMRKPLDIDSFPTLPLRQVACLDGRLVSALETLEIKALFPVQVAVWQQIVGRYESERDLCICSPTGSGKTLAYALPIVQVLSSRIVKRLRALVVLPTRDLAIQVIDESDRLLKQNYQDWLPHTLDRISANAQLEPPILKGLQRGFDGANHCQAMKMVLSATSTRDPSKISQVKLHFPLFISGNAKIKRYQVPEQLQSYRLVADADKKPLHLISLLSMLKEQKTIVFTASIISTHNVFLLLQCCGTDLKAVEYSSLQHQHNRSKALGAFRRGDATVLVASDAMTRGMDVEGVMNVINYDVPVYAKTYVHRAGRTARAGNPGCCYTLLRKQEVRHFKNMLQKVENSKCKRFKLPTTKLDEMYPLYIEGLTKLEELVAMSPMNFSGRSSSGAGDEANQAKKHTIDLNSVVHDKKVVLDGN